MEENQYSTSLCFKVRSFPLDISFENQTFISFDELKHKSASFYYGLIAAIPTGPNKMEEVRGYSQKNWVEVCRPLTRRSPSYPRGEEATTVLSLQDPPSDRLFFSSKQSNKPTFIRKQSLKLWFQQRKYSQSLHILILDDP